MANKAKKKTLGHRLSVLAVLAATLSFGLFEPAWTQQSNYYAQAKDAERAEKFDEAIELYKRALSESSGAYGPATERLANLYMKLHRYDDAEQLVNEASRTSHDVSLQLQLAEIYREAGNHYAAIRQYEEILARDPESANAYVGLGQSCESTGNVEKARDCYNRAIAKGGAEGEKARRKLDGMGSGSSSSYSIDPDTKLGFWMPKRMPLKVFMAASEPNCEVGLPFVRAALDEWNSRAGGIVRTEPTSDRSKADIVVLCVPHLKHRGALGVTQVAATKNNVIGYAAIQIATGVNQSNTPLPPQSAATSKLYDARDRMVREVALHEFGHAFGLTHSDKKDDILANGIFGLNSADVMTSRALSNNDIQRLEDLYKLRDSNIASSKEYAKRVIASGKSVNPHDRPSFYITDADGMNFKGSDDDEDEVTTASTAGDDDNEMDESSDGTLNISGNPSVSRKTSQSPNTKRNQPPASKISASAAVTNAAMESVLFNFRLSNFDQCVKELNMILITEPKNAQAHYMLAITLAALRRYDDASKHYHEVLKLQPTGKLATLSTTGLSKIDK